MKTLCTLVAIFLCVTALPLIAQEVPDIVFGILVTNGGDASQVLSMGAAEGATSNIDELYGEYELPPYPPTEIFDVRLISTPGKSDLGTGTVRDVRGFPATPGQFTETYTVSYQAGQGASGVTFTWEEPVPSRMLSCTIDGKDISTVTEVSTQFAQGQVTIVMVMSTNPLGITASPASLIINVDNTKPLPVEHVQITCENDKDATWDVVVDGVWMDVDPISAAGDQELSVAITTSLLQPGSYNGTITVQARFEDVSVEIPVMLQVTVDVGDIPAPRTVHLGQNYPNPFGAFAPGAPIFTRIPVTMNVAVNGSPPELSVYDVFGRQVADLSSAIRNEPGEQLIEFSASGLSAGMYWYKLTHKGSTQTKTMIITK